MKKDPVSIKSMIWLYRLFFFPVLILVTPYYLWRMYKRGGYINHFTQRFGFLSKIKKSTKKRIWIQAVSVGEVQAIQPLIQKLSNNDNIEIFLTTTTSTGFKRATELFKEKVLAINFFPLDFFLFNKLAWSRVQPDECILMESELWPEHINSAHKKQIPITLINGRISDRSFSRYSKCKCISRYLLNRLSNILTCSELDTERFINLGANPQKIITIGNLKLDLIFQELSDDEKTELKNSLGFEKEDVVLLGASTWPKEEAWLIDFKQIAKENGLSLSLLLVPRHAERRNEIINLFDQKKLEYHVRSKGFATRKVKISLADTTGELKKLIQIADLVFIGKSLFSNVGGQSPVEIAAAGKAMVYGPNMSNFRSICAQLESLNGAIKCPNEIEANKQLIELLKNRTVRNQIGENAKKWLNANSGAVDRTLSILLDNRSSEKTLIL